MKLLPILMITVSLVGCATNKGERLAQVSVGMTKAEVISVMGTPGSVSAAEGVEVLRYPVSASRALFSTDFAEYYVRLVGGQVTDFGNASELGKGTADPKH